jgi:hypothetical protein
MRKMPSLSSGLLRAGLALKLSHVKLAIRSYVRDWTNQATDTAASYAVAAGLFAAAGIFLIAACLVGITALFRWIEIRYGLFPAFGAVGALLILVAAVCAAMAASRLKRPPTHFPSLTSRLRVAIKAGPVKPAPIEQAHDTAEAVLLAPSTPLPRNTWRRIGATRDSRNIQAGLILTATLLGWAALRRRQVRRTAV